MPMKSTPVGPVAGGIMGCFLVLALGVYCYRHHIHRSSHQYINNLPENQNRMSHFYEEEPPEPADDIAAGLWCYSIIVCYLNIWYVRNATLKKNCGICSYVSYFIVVVFHPICRIKLSIVLSCEHFDIYFLLLQCNFRTHQFCFINI